MGLRVIRTFAKQCPDCFTYWQVPSDSYRIVNCRVCFENEQYEERRREAADLEWDLERLKKKSFKTEKARLKNQAAIEGILNRLDELNDARS